MLTLTFPVAVEKPWGKTLCLYQDATHEIWHASIQAGKQCSRHYHANKTNVFYVASGMLMVHTWQDPSDETSQLTYILKANNSLSVPPGAWHSFEAVTDVELIETYHVTVDPEDIVRHVPL